MTLTSFIAGILITTVIVLRSFTVKIGTKNFSSKQITFANGAYIVIFLIMTIPFMYDLLLPLKEINTNKCVPLLACIIKGILLYLSLKYTAEIAKESNSSSFFAGFISLGIGAIINSFILSESLTYPQLFSCIALSILGVIFFLKGPACDLSKYVKKLFILLTILIIINMTTDKIGIGGFNWYIYSMISSTVCFLISTFFLLREKQYNCFKQLKQPALMAIGVVFTMGEFAILYSMQHFLSVSITFLFMRIATPIIMILSAYIYKERTPKEQFLFGILALLFALPVLFR
ncbi:hypothetical protein HDR60_00980 [bacterium]|nr:hypothetical protein [bacterium]